eukprot:Nitzschia sp. Nitz4//NODE_159_length_47236_cov_74.723851//8621//10611//NITZ4_additional_000004-RA//-1//CDS//3329531731//6655//frame0
MIAELEALERDGSYRENLKYFQSRFQSQKRDAVVLDLFGGIGSAVVALKRLGISIKRVIHVEHDKIANHVYRHNHGSEENPQEEHVIVDSFSDFSEMVQWYDGRFGPFDIIIGAPPRSRVSASGDMQHIAWLRRFGALTKQLKMLRMKRGLDSLFFLAEIDIDKQTLANQELEDIESSFDGAWSLFCNTNCLSPLSRSRTYVSNIPFLSFQDLDEGGPDGGVVLDNEGPFHLPDTIFRPNRIAKASDLLSEVSTVDRWEMNVYGQLESTKSPDQLKYRRLTVQEREKLLGLPENYVWKPVDDLFTNLVENGLEKCFKRPRQTLAMPSRHWKDCLPSKYHEFAGDYHGFRGRWHPFRFEIDTGVVKLKLAPPTVSGTRPSYFNSEQYAKRLLGEASSIPMLVVLLEPISRFFHTNESNPTYCDYNYAWEEDSCAEHAPEISELNDYDSPDEVLVVNPTPSIQKCPSTLSVEEIIKHTSHVRELQDNGYFPQSKKIRKEDVPTSEISPSTGHGVSLGKAHSSSYVWSLSVDNALITVYDSDEEEDAHENSHSYDI